MFPDELPDQTANRFLFASAPAAHRESGEDSVLVIVTNGMERTSAARDGEPHVAPSPMPVDSATCVLCADRIGSQPWAQLACGAEHVAHNVCLFERALASECCAVRCGRVGCRRLTPVASATTMYAGVRRLDASRHVKVAEGRGHVTAVAPSGGGPDEARRGSAAALEASGPELAALPFELLVRVLFHLSSARDLASANAASRLFRGAPSGRSAVEHALRERAVARGHGRLLPTLPPTWTPELLERERVLETSALHASVASCSLLCNTAFSAFVDAEGGLHTCGEEGAVDEEDDYEEEWRQFPYYRTAATGHGAASEAPPVLVPTRVPSLSAVRVRAVAAGGCHLLALSEAGAVYACGDNECGQLGFGDRHARGTFVLVDALLQELVVGIAAGAAHSLVLTADGRAYSWGDNECGQLGHGDTEHRLEPTRIEALDGVHVGGVAAGYWHTLMLSTGGSVYACGIGDFGKLGHADEQEQRTPRRIEALAGVRAVHVSAGGEHSLVVDAVGGVHSFGAGGSGCLGHGDRATHKLPTRIEALAGMRAVRCAAGDSTSAVVCADGSVHTFGHNRSGELGLGHTSDPVLGPGRVHALSHERVIHCSLGDAHALFVTADGAVHSCGERSAALGLGVGAGDESASAATPTPVQIAQLPPLAIV